MAYRNKILIKLKEMGALITDKGFSRKIMIAKIRFESVQISRSFFTKDGEIDIINLGMEAD